MSYQTKSDYATIGLFNIDLYQEPSFTKGSFSRLSSGSVRKRGSAPSLTLTLTSLKIYCWYPDWRYPDLNTCFVKAINLKTKDSFKDKIPEAADRAHPADQLGIILRMFGIKRAQNPRVDEAHAVKIKLSTVCL